MMINKITTYIFLNLIDPCFSTMMKEIYRIIGICLGIPPKTFVWQYTDKSKQVIFCKKGVCMYILFLGDREGGGIISTFSLHEKYEFKPVVTSLKS